MMIGITLVPWRIGYLLFSLLGVGDFYVFFTAVPGGFTAFFRAREDNRLVKKREEPCFEALRSLCDGDQSVNHKGRLDAEVSHPSASTNLNIEVHNCMDKV